MKILFDNLMISIVVDDLATSAPEFFMYAQQALKKLLASGVEPSDLISFSTASGSVNQPFTSDRDLLLSLAEDLHKKVQRAGNVKSQCPELTDMQAQQIRNNHPDNMSLRVAVAETIICQNIQDQPNLPAAVMAEPVVRSAAAQQFEENQHRYRSLLTSLKQYLRSLRHFEGRKSLILISDGFLSDYVRYELQDVTDMKVLQNLTHDADMVVAAIRQPAMSHAETNRFGQGVSREDQNRPGAAGQRGGQTNRQDPFGRNQTLDPQAKFRSTVLLRTLGQLSSSMSRVKGRKSILMFSEDFSLASDAQVELRNTIQAAQKANVAFYSIDARGLNSLGGANQGSLLPGDMPDVKRPRSTNPSASRRSSAASTVATGSASEAASSGAVAGPIPSNRPRKTSTRACSAETGASECRARAPGVTTFGNKPWNSGNRSAAIQRTCEAVPFIPTTSLTTRFSPTR